MTTPKMDDPRARDADGFRFEAWVAARRCWETSSAPGFDQATRAGLRASASRYIVGAFGFERGPRTNREPT